MNQPIYSRFDDPWWNTIYEPEQYQQYFPNSWPPTSTVQPIDYETSMMATPSHHYTSPCIPEMLDMHTAYNMGLISYGSDTTASSPAMWNSISEPPSPTASHASLVFPQQSGSADTNDHGTEPSQRLKRRAQNRAAQQAHRERKKKLVEDLWIEIHTLRHQNEQLQKQLKAKTEMLREVCGRLQGTQATD